MAKILYGVAGEGFGHSSRSHLIGGHLLEAGHDVMFAASNKSLEYLWPIYGERVHEVGGLGFAYHKGKVSAVRTVAKNAAAFAGEHRKNVELFGKAVRDFGPDVVVTDFEPFSAWWALRHRVPFVSVDHEHVLTHCKLESVGSVRLWASRLNAWVVTRCYYFGAAAYVVVNFFEAPCKGENTVVAPPVVRAAVQQTQVGDGDHVVVYMTASDTKERILDVLGRFGSQKFIVYGYGEESVEGNCVLKKRSTEGFLADVAGGRGVMATAGFSLISECLYLRKPMLLVPLAGQFEQEMNAYMAEKLGVAVSSRRLDERAVERFLRAADKGFEAGAGVLMPDNGQFLEVFDRTLSRVI